MRPIRHAAVVFATVVALTGCGTESGDGAQNNTVGWFSPAGADTSTTTPGTTPGTTPVSPSSLPLQPGEPALTVPDSVTTSKPFPAVGHCPTGGFGATTADIGVNKPGMSGSGEQTTLPVGGELTQTITLRSLDYDKDGRVELTLTCTRYLDENHVRSETRKVTESIAVTSTYRPATLDVPVKTVAIGGKLRIRGRCPYPGAHATANLTDSAGPALQQAFSVASDGTFDADIDLSKPVNAPRPTDKPAMQPGAGTIGMACTAGPETSVGVAVPITITGDVPSPPPTDKATVNVTPGLVSRGDTIIVTGTYPADSWNVAVTAADGSGVFNSTGGPPDRSGFNFALRMAVGPNEQAGHPATISGDTVTVHVSCNRLPQGGNSQILFDASTTVKLR